MSKMIIKLIEIAILIAIFIILLFIFVNCKIENIRLQTKYDILNDKYTDLKKELAGSRQMYSTFLLHLLNSNKISWNDLKEHLSPAEIQEMEMILKNETKDSATATKKKLQPVWLIYPMK